MNARRTRTQFVCSACGGSSPRWSGRCAECGEWNTLVEEIIAPALGRSTAAAPARFLADVDLTETERIASGLGDFDRLLGGGIVPGGLYLVGGEPGIGKSTLLIQVAARVAASGRSVLYLAGEESPAQVKLRSDRLGVESETPILLAPGTALDALIAVCETARPEVVVLDSVQAVYDPALSSAPGSVSQVRAAAVAFQRWCKTSGSAAFLVGHVTKGGGIAGPKTLEHAVDAVLQFEGDPHHDWRVLRALKNRYGSTQEVAVFTMSDRGLEPVDNPSIYFVDPERRASPTPGSVHVASVEGTRPLVIEIQALVAPSPYGTPQRVAGGFDARRLALLLAVLDRKAGVSLGPSDIFVNVVGGLTLREPAADLGVVVALASSQSERSVRVGTILFGEVGLTGEIRPVRLAEARLREAARLGFRRAVIARNGDRGTGNETGIEVAPARTVAEAVALALERP